MLNAAVEKARTPDRPQTLLILDQFEEVLSRLDDSQSRERLGHYLRTAISSGWRIVVGVRKEYVADIQEIAKQLDRRITLDEDIFNVRNFDMAEAANVIGECAARDSIQCSTELRLLIAGDLAINKQVRPPDLQIVCYSLCEDMTVERYREEGRATGLRAKFVAEMMDLAGNPNLTRGILRDLCDIPNEKKHAPRTSAEILASISVNHPHATVDSVAGVLEHLAEAYIVLKTSATPARWLLVHDYLVEPIKLATEAAETKRESLLAELGSFRAALARDRRLVIPVEKVREIRRNLPQQLISDRVTRNLLRRSSIIGYGKPLGLNLSIVFASLFSVILLTAQWDVWQPIGDASRDVIGLASRDMPLRAWRTTSSEGSKIIISLFGNYERADASQFSVWDTDVGREVGKHSDVKSSGALPNLGPYAAADSVDENRYLWSYNAATGEIRRWDGDKEVDWRHIAPRESRPGAGFVISQFQPAQPQDGVIFERERCTADTPSCIGILLPKSTLNTRSSWREITRASISPDGRAEPGSKELMFFTKNARGWAVSNTTGRTRVTIWPADMTQPLCTSTFDDPMFLVGVSELDGSEYAGFYAPASRQLHMLSTAIEAVPGERACNDVTDTWPGQPGESVASSAVGEALPGISEVLSTPKHFLLRQDELTRTIIWPIQIVQGKFEKPIIASNVAPRVGRAFVWTTGSSTSIWPANRDTVTSLPLAGLSASDQISFDENFGHMLRTNAAGHADLFKIALDTNEGARSVLAIKESGFTNFHFSHDQKAIIGRRRGGELFGWSLNGDTLGALGGIGSRVVWSAYDADCERMLIWTDEGQMLDWRRGIQMPLLGFFPANDCPGSPTRLSGAIRNARIETKNSPLSASVRPEPRF